MTFNPKKLPSSKKQRSILQWSNQGKTVIKKDEVIDLTVEDTGIVIKEEVDSVLVTQEEITDVNCPVCEVNITHQDVDSRIKHVEKCLLFLTLKEKRSATTADICNKRKKKDNNKLSDSNAVYVNKKPKLIQVKTKEIKLPVNISPSKRKSTIPNVKVLKFPLRSDNMYHIAVDAFCYAPDELIDQYFLTHFHSDHYGGITKKWCYERLDEIPANINEIKFRKIIYCTVVTSKLLTLRFNVDPRFIAELELDKRYIIKAFGKDKALDIEEGALLSEGTTPGLYVTPISANHCPGSAIFLFESISTDNNKRTVLHCGDFRVNKEMILHRCLLPFFIDIDNFGHLDSVYLDTTYMTPKYNFPKQENVCDEVSEMLYRFIHPDESDSLIAYSFGILRQSRITDFMMKFKKKKKLLILIGTYLIGKENLAISISKRLKCAIYVSNINSRGDKSEIIRTFQDSYLNSILTENELGDDCECIIHLVPMKIVSSITELSNYFNHNRYHSHFERCVGFRPSGWTFSNPWEVDSSQIGSNPSFSSSIHVQNEKNISELYQIMHTQPQYSYLQDIIQEGCSGSKNSNTDSSLYKLYAIPYSEHSSFRELCFFSIFLNIKNIIPTVNIENQASIMKMDSIIQSWKYFREIKLNPKTNLNTSLIGKIQDLSINDF